MTTNVPIPTVPLLNANPKEEIKIVLASVVAGDFRISTLVEEMKIRQNLLQLNAMAKLSESVAMKLTSITWPTEIQRVVVHQNA